ncbi:MAG: glycogen/starch/alpha-glucan phosphorylase [bacterium]|nr:glycogen/starch/alpha-glucan phosphorylase [bacterium]
MPNNKLSGLLDAFLGMDDEALAKSFVHHLEHSLAKDQYSATQRDCLVSQCLAVRDRIIDRWNKTQQTYYEKEARRVYYLSLEFLIGRTLGNSLINLGLYETAGRALLEFGYQLETLEEAEHDAGLGNGGLGRLAACFLDSMATLELPAYGYGIRYEYGIFYQQIKEGYQIETPDNWLRYGNPWEVERPEVLFPIEFYGRVMQHTDSYGTLRHTWVDTQGVMAMAYDTPVPGYRNNTVNTMRLWSAKSTRDFDLDHFNEGDYEEAVVDKVLSETITRVLYPKDNAFAGRELRLKQQYFFVSATLQDAMRRHLKTHKVIDNFADKTAMQLNDTHPAIAIPELMRLLVDNAGMAWDEAWEITSRTFAYTNHTVLPEALEKWRVALMQHVLPRHMQIIFEINRRFLDQVRERYPNDEDRVARMSIIEEGDEKRVRMANLAIVGSHKVNGVAQLHSDLLTTTIFKDFFEFFPEKFTNKTNGITQRRWLRLCNPKLSDLITSRIGDAWITDLDRLRDLEPLVEDPEFCDQWRQVKIQNKKRLARTIRKLHGIEASPDSIFDCQVKRIHEYKRQLLNAMHVVALYNRILENPSADVVPRTIIFGGKAAPGYFQAKLIIKLITSIAETVNRDPDIDYKLRVAFMANYSVSLAEKIIPAADLSEQISTAGMEASGTGNMKFALNGALTIGTLDGANIEIKDAVGDDNIFIFGLTVDEIVSARNAGYNPHHFYNTNAELRRVVDQIGEGRFSPQQPDLFQPIIRTLLHDGDPYMIMADFGAYLESQDRVSNTYRDTDAWTRMSILNTARVGRFSSDRTIREYANEIWHVDPIPVKI